MEGVKYSPIAPVIAKMAVCRATYGRPARPVTSDDAKGSVAGAVASVHLVW